MEARYTNKIMRARRLIFALFAGALLFSMVREWSAPSSCLRLEIARGIQRR
jgi:hypothetical protein